MLFLIRSAFWLTIVFASIPWPGDAPEQVSSLSANLPKTRDILARTLGHARAGIDKACLDAPSACLDTAALLSRIVADKRPDDALKAPLQRPAARP